jgi:hypothetical protein
MMKSTVFSIALLAGACTVTTNSSIDSTPLAGTVSGQSWSFVAGNTDSFLSSGQDNYYATLYATAFTPCSGVEPSGPHLIVAIPKTAGDYQMSLSRNMTFTDGSDNKIATDGRIVVSTVSATTVSGGLHGTYDASNEVSGQFTVTICP